MQLPVNPKDILGIAVSTQQAQDQSVSVSVYLDETAPAELVAHVRSVYASSSARARITLSYLDFAHHAIEQKDDMVVLVAGGNNTIGEVAEKLRAADLNVMIVAASEQAALQVQQANEVEIPEGDLIYPDTKQQASANESDEPVEVEVEVADKKSGMSAKFHSFVAPEKEPEVSLSEDEIRSLDLKMGRWISSKCADKRLAFATAFPFVRRPVALDSVNLTAIENGAVGAIILIPGADLPVMTLNQVKMLLQIASAYGQPLSLQRIKELACVIGGGFCFRGISRSLCGVVPILGPVIKAAIGYGGTIAMGRTAIEYFEGGGGIVGLGKTVARARDSVVKAILKGKKGGKADDQEPQTSSEKIAKAARAWGEHLSKFASVTSEIAGPLLSGAANVGVVTLKDGVTSILRLRR